MNFRNRLQELENESEQLDKSFQNYLKKQNEQKRVLADDIGKVWEQYERAKENMIKTFVVPERRNIATNMPFHENVIPVPVPNTNDEPFVRHAESETNQFENPYKILHANLTMTGQLDPSINKKEVAFQANGGIPTLTLQRNERTISADKVSQIPVPMKIKSIIKKPIENESTTHLRISTSVGNDHPLSDPSDASSYINVRNVSSSEPVHSGDLKASVHSKHSEFSLNSPQSNRSEGIKNGNTNIERSEVVTNEIIVQTDAIQTETVPTQPLVDTKDISSLFQRIDLKNHSTHSTLSDNSEKRNISTGQRSISSDEFWK